MFTIHDKEQNGFHKVVLRDDSSGTFIEVVPSCGAILNSFIVLQKEQEINILHSYESGSDFKENVTAKGFLGCKLSPFVCRVNKGKYRFEEKEYKIEKFYLENNAIHGELYDQAFVVAEKSADEEKAVVVMKYNYKKNDAGYPFNYECSIKYELEKENKVNVFTEIINKDEGNIPMQDGWHPYFKLGNTIDDLQIQFKSKELIEFNDDLIPTGNFISYNEFNSLQKIGGKFFDNCFVLNFSEQQPMCVLKSPGNKMQIEISPDKSYPYLQIYTPPHRKSISLENLSSVPDGFNNGIGLKVLTPGASVQFKTSYKISMFD